MRGSIEGEERRARLSAIYSTVAFVTVPFLMLIVPRIYFTLHPDPVINTTGKIQMAPEIRIGMFGMALGFTALFFWMMRIRVRLARIERHRSAASAA